MRLFSGGDPVTMFSRWRADDRAEDHDELTEQAEQRRRRRARQRIVYGGGFSLTTEVAEIVTPLADRIAAEPSPSVWLPRVTELADATPTAIVAVTDMLAEVDALRRTRHLPVDTRGRAVVLIREQAKQYRPDRPVVTVDDLAAGSWAAVLIDMARPYSDPLAGLLSRAVQPGTTRGRLTPSEAVVTVLRLIDSPAIAIRKTLDTAAAGRVARQPPRPTRSDEIAAALAALGVEP